MVIYLLRHGDVEGGRILKGDMDLPLSAAGQAQAWYWQGYFAHTPLTAVYTSRLSRTMETAEIILRNREVLPQAEAAFNEMHLGLWQGLRKQEVQKNFPGQWEARGADPAGYQPPQGESFNQLALRVMPIFSDILSSQPNDAHLLFVLHSAVIRVITAQCLGLSLSHILQLQLDLAGLAILDGSLPLLNLVHWNIRPEL